MKGYGKTNESKQRSLQSEYFDTQNNNLDTEMYLKDKVKHVMLMVALLEFATRKMESYNILSTN